MAALKAQHAVHVVPLYHPPLRVHLDAVGVGIGILANVLLLHHAVPPVTRQGCQDAAKLEADVLLSPQRHAEAPHVDVPFIARCECDICPIPLRDLPVRRGGACGRGDEMRAQSRSRRRRTSPACAVEAPPHTPWSREHVAAMLSVIRPRCCAGSVLALQF